MQKKDIPVIYEYLSYRITRPDEYNYALEKYTLVKKVSHNNKEDSTKKSFKNVGYSSTFEFACRLLKNNLMREKMNYKQISRLVQMFERDVEGASASIIDRLNKVIERQGVILDKMNKKIERMEKDYE